MKKPFILVTSLALALLLAACSDENKIPDVKDPNHPTDNRGNPMTKKEFLDKYCNGIMHPSCGNVEHAFRIEEAKKFTGK